MKSTLATLTLTSLVLSVQGFAPHSASIRTTTAADFQTTTRLASTVDDKTEVREYFNTEGFNRWNKIYSESDEVNSVQLDIRNGHDQTIQKILNWIKADGDIKGKTVCDCGCGVGSLAIPLAQMGKFSSLVNLYHMLLLYHECSFILFILTTACMITCHICVLHNQEPKSMQVTFPILWQMKLHEEPRHWGLKMPSFTLQTSSQSRERMIQ